MKRIGVYYGIGAVLAALAIGSGVSRANGTPEKQKERGAAACFEQMKKLAGEWVRKDPSGKEVVTLRYRVTSAGSAIEESELPGSDHEMITVYHIDGESVALTHYCALGNQPRMKSTPDSTPNKINFECTGVGNTKSHSEMHMHALTITIKDNDHIVSEWTLSKDGKDGEKAKFEATRKGAK